MIINKYGVTLTRICEKDIELIRRKRNSAFVSQYMLYRERITPKMQKEWFRKIDNDCNVYFLIRHGRKNIGLTHAANISWTKKTAEGGIFLWDEDYINTPIPIIASLISFELFFTIFRLNKSFIKILKSNERAIDFNEMVGFKRTSDDAAKSYYDYSLLAADYRKKSRSLLAFIQKMSGDDTPLNEKNIDFSSHRSKSDLALYSHLPVKWRTRAMSSS